MRARLPVRLLTFASGVLFVAGCAFKSPAVPDRLAGEPAPAPTLAWPHPPPEPLRLVLRSGTEGCELVDHGSPGNGRLYELRLPKADAPRRIDADIGTTERSLATMSGRITPSASFAPAWLGGIYFFTTAGMIPTEFTATDGTKSTLSIVDHRSAVFLNYRVPRGAEVRGTVVFLSSLGGMTPGERRLMDELERRGWWVIWSSPSLAPLEAHFGEHFDVSAEMVAGSVATRIDETLSEIAYAIEAALDHLYEQEPSLRGLPLLAVGCSAGAINLPTVVARQRETVDAAVLIAGGADLISIIQRSHLLRGNFSVRVEGRTPTADELREIGAATLAKSALDPYHCAAFLARQPVLMLHAMFDAIVPASSGDQLYERLGRPERWSYPLGHIGLLVWLPTQARAIADWIDEQVPSGGGFSTAETASDSIEPQCQDRTPSHGRRSVTLP